MKSSKPPALATWLLEHLIPESRSEPLAGDLLEQFCQRRSAAWYWRQVLVAILVGFSKELRILWTAIGVTMAWILALSQFYGRFWAFAQLQAATGWGMRHGWAPSRAHSITNFIALNVLPVTLAVGMYLGLTNAFRLRRFLRGLSAGLLTMALGFYLCFMQSPLWLWRHQDFVGHLVASLPVFFALLLSMWAAQPNDGRGTARISA